GGVRHPVYFDNFRLVAGKEPEHTQSLIQPAHCIVTIDNRYVYPQLAGKVEEVLNSQEIVNLRVQAHKAVEALETEIEIAEMQGFQALYERIPLLLPALAWESDPNWCGFRMKKKR